MQCVRKNFKRIVQSSTEKYETFVARFEETNKDGRSSLIPDSRFPRNVLSWNPSLSSAVGKETSPSVDRLPSGVTRRQGQQCVKSKKLRYVSTRTILRCRSQSILKLVFNILRRLMCRIAPSEIRSPKIRTREKMICLEVLKTQKDDRFFRGIQIDLIILRTYTHVSLLDYFHLFGISLIIRWNSDFCQCIDTHGRYSGKLV